MIKEFLIAIRVIAVFILVLVAAIVVIAIKYPDQRPPFPGQDKITQAPPPAEYVPGPTVRQAYKTYYGLVKLAEEADRIYQEAKEFNERQGIR